MERMAATQKEDGFVWREPRVDGETIIWSERVVRIVDLLQDAEKFYVVMEEVDGIDFLVSYPKPRSDFRDF